jgi:hypothetical protein
MSPAARDCQYAPDAPSHSIRPCAFVSVPKGRHPYHSGLVQLILSVMLPHGG